MTAPEGFEGEFRMMTFVRGVIRRGDHLGGHAESLRFVGLQQNAVPARITNDVFERNPVRNRQDHFVAVIYQNLNGIEQCMLAADGGDDFFAPVVGIKIDVMTVRNRVAQFGCACDGRVLGEVRLEWLQWPLP